MLNLNIFTSSIDSLKVLNDYSKNELLTVAFENEIHVKPFWTKERIIQAIALNLAFKLRKEEHYEI